MGRHSDYGTKSEDYKPYGTSYTPRQINIINGLIPDVKNHELVILLKKTISLNDYDYYEKLSNMYGYINIKKNNFYNDMQREIIDGIYDGKITPARLQSIIKIATETRDQYVIDAIYEQYFDILYSDYDFKYSYEESKQLLQDLTPWDIYWWKEK